MELTKGKKAIKEHWRQTKLICPEHTGSDFWINSEGEGLQPAMPESMGLRTEGAGHTTLKRFDKLLRIFSGTPNPLQSNIVLSRDKMIKLRRTCAIYSDEFA